MIQLCCLPIHILICDSSSIFVCPQGAFIFAAPVQKSSSDKQQQLFHTNCNGHKKRKNYNTSNPGAALLVNTKVKSICLTQPFWWSWKICFVWTSQFSWCTFAKQNFPHFNYILNIRLGVVFQLIKFTGVGLWKSDIQLNFIWNNSKTQKAIE